MTARREPGQPNLCIRQEQNIFEDLAPFLPRVQVIETVRRPRYAVMAPLSLSRLQSSEIHLRAPNPLDPANVLHSGFINVAYAYSKRKDPAYIKILMLEDTKRSWPAHDKSNKFVSADSPGPHLSNMFDTWKRDLSLLLHPFLQLQRARSIQVDIRPTLS